ncbi:Ig-like domain-containing protein [Pedobacter psychrophilus]|nr:Ig-like domain-containing protein [Pedobacter psychrophilus]
MKDLIKVLLFLSFIFLNSASFSQICGTSGLDGPQNAVPPVNTYFPLSTTATLIAGSKTIVLNAVPPNDPNYNLSYGITPIKSGDLILIIQMQDASFNYLNSNLYGSGLANSGPDNLGGTGFTSLNNSGKFEYVVATSDVPITGGILNFRGDGTGKGCVNTYTNSNASPTAGQKRFQVIRVPQYSNLVLTANITTPPYNGSVGGLIAFDVAGTMQFNGFIVDASARGFRGGYGPKAASNANNSTFYVGPSSSTTSVGKGEGIGGTPRYMWDGFNQVDNGSDGLPSGSYGRGAPANGGGAGNDHNAGGGGGGNGGYGGLGGMGWQGANGDVSPKTGGGRPGSFLPIDYSRLIMGGGGGGGDANDALSGVTGGVGGGIVLINVEKIVGVGVIKSNGGNGAPGVYGTAPDGAGGGGAGGSIFVRSLAASPTANLSLEAKGGRGGNTLKDNNNEHGPGGGGGGGFIYTQIPSATIVRDVSKGISGKANNGAGISHGAIDGTDGQTSSFITSDLPLHLQGGGSICYPILTTILTELHPGAPGARSAGTTATYTLTIQNEPTNGNAGNVEAWFNLPSSFKVSSISYALTGDAAGTLNATPHIGATGIMSFGNFNISPGDKVVITIVVNIAANAPTGVYHASAQATYLDPTRTKINPFRKITGSTDEFVGFNSSYETGGVTDVVGTNYNGDLVTSTAEDVYINAVAITGLCDAVTGGGFETYTSGEYPTLDKWLPTVSGDLIKIVNQTGIKGAIIKNKTGEKFSLQQTIISIEPLTAYTLTFNYRNWDACGSPSASKSFIEILDANTNAVIVPQAEFIASNSPAIGNIPFNTLSGTTSIIIKITDAGSPNPSCGTFIDGISITSNLNISYPTTNVTCNGANNGTVKITLLSGAAAPYQVSYSFNEGSFNTATPINPINITGTPLVYNNLTAGNYRLKIVDANGCDNIKNFDITQPPILSLSETHIDNSCNDNSIGAIDLTVSGGTSPYTYNWVKDGTSYAVVEDISSLPPGHYTVTVTDDNSCQKQLSVDILPLTPFTLNGNQINNICNGSSLGSITLISTGGKAPYSYTWSNGSHDQNQTNLPAGIYNVIGKDGLGCEVSLDFIIIEPTALNLTESHNIIICNGGTSTVTLTATGGTGIYQYSKDGIAFQTSNIFSGLIAGDYTFTVKDANDCTYSTPGQITISEPTQLGLSTTKTDILCNGGTSTVTLTATGGTGIYQYSKDGIAFQASNIFNNLTAGDYTFTVKDAYDCSFSTPSQIIINEPTKLDLSTSKTDIICNGGTSTVTLTATGGTGIYQYSKDGIAFQASNIFNNLTAGDYTFTVKDANGCTFSTSSQITISEPTKLDLTSSKTDILCNGGTSTVTLSATGGTGIYQYSKNGIAFQGSNIFSGLSAGNYTFTVKDANDCSFSTPSQIIIDEPTKLGLSTTKTDIICNGGTSIVTLTATGGTGIYQYSKDGIAFQTSNIFSGLVAGNYTFTVKDANGCTFSTPSQITISEPTVLTLSASKTDILCNGGTSTVTLTATGGTGIYQYSKDGISFQGSNIFSGLIAGDYTFTIKDANGCTYSTPSQITISEPTALTLSASKTDILCNGETSTVTLTATGGTGIYQYSKDGIAFQASNIFSGLIAGNYTFSVKDANNCTFSTPSQIIISEPTKLDLSISKTDILCNGGTSTVILTATGGTGVYQYSKDGIAFQTSNIFSGLIAGDYTFTVKDANDCTYSTSGQIMIIEPTKLDLSTSKTDILCNGGTSTVTLTATGGTGVYQYSKDGIAFQTSNIFSGLIAGNYTFAVKDENGCTFTTPSQVTIAEPTKLDLLTSKTDILCNGGTSNVTLTATGGTGIYQYSKDGIAFQASNIFSGLISGNYTFTVKDANGCTFSTPSQLNITEPTQLDLSSTKTDILCNGETSTVTLTATGGTGIYQYSKDGIAFQASNIFSGLSAGNYTFTVKDANGCTFSTPSQITISEPNVLTLSISKTDILCNGETSTVTLTATGGTGIYQYSKDGITFQGSNIFSGLSAGNYTFSVKDANNCTFSTPNQIIVSEPTALTLSSTKTDILCNGGTSTVTLTATGGTGIYQYSKDGIAFQTSNIFSGLIAGNYTFTVKDANGCTFSTPSQIIILEPTALTLSSTKTDIICNGGTSTLTLTATGGTGIYQYSKDGIAFQASNIFNNLAAGNYSFTVKDANGCTFSTPSQIIISEPTKLDLSTSKTDILCNGGTSTVTLTATGGTGVYQYSKDGIAFQASNIFSALIAGNYTFTVKDANGCTYSTPSQITISEPTALILSASKTDILCNGGTSTVTLMASGGTGVYQYSKDGIAFQTSNIFSGLIAGNYSFTVKDANGCTFSTPSQITISEPTALTLSASKTDILCNGGTSTVTLTGTGGTGIYQYSKDGIVFQGSNIFSGLIAGNYTFTVKDANNCTFSTPSQIIISEPTQLGLSLTKTDILCNGGTSTVTLTGTGGTGVYQYSKDGIAFQASNIFNNLTAGNYNFTVKDANGCTFTTPSQIIISEPTKLDLSTSKTDILCNGGTSIVTLTATGGTGIYQYSKDGISFQGSNIFSELIAGNYIFTVKDANNCTFSTPSQVTIAEPTKLDLSSSKTDILCNGGTSTVTSTATGGIGIYQYSKDGIAFQVSNIFSGLSAGNYTFTVKDANGCTFSTPSQIIISEPTQLDLSSTKTDILCNGGTSTVTLTATGGIGIYQYSKDGIAFQASNIFSGLSAGNYTLTVKDANGCVFSTPSQIIISEPTALPLSASKTDILCNGGTSTVTLIATGGSGVYQYSKDGITFQASNIFNNLTAGNYTFTVKDVNGCTFSTLSQIIISEPTALTLSSTKTDILCNGGTSKVTLTATGGTGVYLYSKDGITFQASNIFNNLTAGNYTFTVKDVNGCTFSMPNQINITEPTKLSISEIHQDINCFGSETGSINISISGGKLPYTFNWSNGATTEDLSNLKKGDYSVIVTDANGCNISKTIKLSEPISPLIITENHQNNICFGEKNGKINVQVSGGTAPYQYKWNTGETIPNLNNIESGTYELTVIDKNGCSQSIEVNITPLKLFKVIESITKILCYGEKGNIKLSLEGGQSPYQISWSNGKTGDYIDNLIAGNYTYTAKDIYGCSISKTVIIVQPQPIAAKINVKNTTCKYSPDGAVLLEVDGGTKPYQFIWNGKNRGENNTLINVNAGKYSVNIIDANNCSLQIVAEVLPGNCAPNADNDFYKTKEDTPITIITPGIIVNDADPDDDFIKISLSSAKDPVMQDGTVLNAKTTFNTVNGIVNLNDNGSFTYTPKKNFYGTENFVYKATDGDLSSNLAIVTIVVEAVNDPPKANNDFYLTNEDIPVTASVAPNDSDPENEKLTFTLVTPPINGKLTFNADGTFNYVPELNFNGVITFNYQVCDPEGLCDQAVATITISPVNDPPIALDDKFYLEKNKQISQTVINNDSDPDGDVLVFTAISQPKNGTLTFNTNGTFVYQPNVGFKGIDTFNYRTCDPFNLCDDALVTLIIQPIVTVNLTPATGIIKEGENIDITAVLTESLLEDVNVSLSFNGTATLNSDYKLTGDYNTINIPAGKTTTTQKFKISAILDDVKDDNESVNAIISNTDQSSYVLIGNGSVVAITDIYPEIKPLGPEENPDINPDPLVSPNGDGNGNETFIIYNISKYPNNEVIIFNRWGNEVYRTKGYDNKGNSFRGVANVGILTNSNKELVDGVYYYIIYTDENNKRKLNKGYLILKR